MEQTPTSFRVQWEGQDYVLSLRLSPDGFLPQWEVSAYHVLAENTDSSLVIRDESACNQFMRIIVDHVREGLVRTTAGPLVPIPWTSWFDLPTDVVEGLTVAFFHSFAAKTKRLRGCSTGTPAPKEPGQTSTAETSSPSTPPSPPMDSPHS
jgi:hypothetical protein